MAESILSRQASQKIPKGVTQVIRVTSTSGSAVQRPTIKLEGVWRLKAIAVNNYRSYVMERTRIIIQAQESFDSSISYEELESGFTRYRKSLSWQGDMNIRGTWVIVGEIQHDSTSTTHDMNVMAERLDVGGMTE